MKNRNGFTLVELLVTVALIGAVSVVVGFSVNRLLYNQKKNDYDDFKKTVEDAGCVFAQDDNRTENLCSEENFETLCNIPFEDLINAGALKKTLTNPFNDKKPISDDIDSYVHVSYVDGKRICEFIDCVCQDEYCKHECKITRG